MNLGQLKIFNTTLKIALKIMKHKIAILDHWHEGQTCKGFQNEKENHRGTQ